MTFLGWKLSTGEVVKGYDTGEKRTDPSTGKEYAIWFYPRQHEAHLYREASGYKGRMTPQYAR